MGWSPAATSYDADGSAGGMNVMVCWAAAGEPATIASAATTGMASSRMD